MFRIGQGHTQPGRQERERWDSRAPFLRRKRRVSARTAIVTHQGSECVYRMRVYVVQQMRLSPNANTSADLKVSDCIVVSPVLWQGDDHARVNVQALSTSNENTLLWGMETTLECRSLPRTNGVPSCEACDFTKLMVKERRAFHMLPILSIKATANLEQHLDR